MKNSLIFRNSKKILSNIKKGDERDIINYISLTASIYVRNDNNELLYNLIKGFEHEMILAKLEDGTFVLEIEQFCFFTNLICLKDLIEDLPFDFFLLNKKNYREKSKLLELDEVFVNFGIEVLNVYNCIKIHLNRLTPYLGEDSNSICHFQIIETFKEVLNVLKKKRV